MCPEVKADRGDIKTGHKSLEPQGFFAFEVLVGVCAASSPQLGRSSKPTRPTYDVVWCAA